MRKADLYDESRKKEIGEIRKKYSLKQARDTEIRILARSFESYWNNYWRSIKTALRRIEQAQKLFITQSDPTKAETPDGHFKIPHLWPPQNPPPVKVAV
jgi:hypothetical protein